MLGSDIGTLWKLGAILLRLDVRRPDHLAPLFNFGCHVGTELRRTKQQWEGDGLSNARLDRGIDQASVDFGIEPFDDLRRDAPSDGESIPAIYLET